jgi:hypothetical protein
MRLDQRVFQHFIYHFSELFDRERLLKGWLFTVALGDAGCAVTCGENKWTFTGFDNFGDWRNHLAIEVHIEDSKVELGRLDELDCLANPRQLRLPRYGLALQACRPPSS